MNIAMSLVMAYLLGSIPFAYLISRTKGVDIRRVGDGNVGAFNVFRHVGLGAGLATLALDIGKGATAIMVAKALHIPEIAVCLAGIAATIGHNWPVFLKFEGGRGEATIIGVLAVLVPWQMAITFVLGIIVLFTTRNSILTAMAIFIPLPLTCFGTNRLLGEPSLTVVLYTALLPCLAGFTHWLTTRRLPPGARKEAGTFWVANKRNR